MRFLKTTLALGMVIAVVLATDVAHAKTDYRIVDVGCKLVLKAGEELYAPTNTVVMIGGENCND